MRIIPATDSDYAYVEWNGEELERIMELESTLLQDPFRADRLRGLQIEVSQEDPVDGKARAELWEGRFYVVP